MASLPGQSSCPLFLKCGIPAEKGDYHRAVQLHVLKPFLRGDRAFDLLYLRLYLTSHLCENDIFEANMG